MTDAFLFGPKNNCLFCKRDNRTYMVRERRIFLCQI